MDRALLDLWMSIISFQPNLEAGIYKEWAKDPYTWGPPLGPERTDPKDKMPYQAFARRIVRWNATKGLEVVFKS